MNSKRWVITTFLTSAILIIILSLITYTIDPLHQYRYSAEKKYPLQPRFSSAGLIKNYEYDSVMLGSSMAQNFLAEDFKKEMDLDILKITMGGMNFPDIKLSMELINETKKCKTMFVGIDIHKFAEDNPVAQVPEYLYNGVYDDYKYLLSSDVYTHFIPLALSADAFNYMNKPVPSIISSKADPNKIGYWNDRYNFGEDVVLKTVEENKNGVSNVSIEGLKNRLHDNIDALFTYVNEDTEYIFFFPPYSAFYWEHCQYNEYMDEFLSAKIYLYEVSQKYDNVHIFDFQNADLTIDLSNYRDTTHYSADINKFMVRCFDNKEYLVENSDTITANNKGISEKVDFIKIKYKETLNKSHQHYTT